MIKHYSISIISLNGMILWLVTIKRHTKMCHFYLRKKKIITRTMLWLYYLSFSICTCQWYITYSELDRWMDRSCHCTRKLSLTVFENSSTKKILKNAKHIAPDLSVLLLSWNLINVPLISAALRSLLGWSAQLLQLLEVQLVVFRDIRLYSIKPKCLRAPEPVLLLFTYI